MIDRNGKKIYNCPNCAAPIGYGDKCEYCGTLLHWIPFDEMKIETVYVNTDKLVAQTAIDRRDLELPRMKDLVLQKLKDMLAERLPEIWRIYEADDWKRDEKIFRAEILVGRRRT